jgi:endonuclease/exonuclease/phosphatase family metal-dependent hydrolase
MSRIRYSESCDVKTGFAGLHGNKGGVAIRFVMDDSSFCFINCHLAAGQSQTSARNNDIRTILTQAKLSRVQHSAPLTFLDGGDGSCLLDYSYCFMSGDLNYRIHMDRDHVMQCIRNEAWSTLHAHDQLVQQFQGNMSFALKGFREPHPPTFAPTYKYDVGTNTYDTSDKQRTPAWCDRILYRDTQHNTTQPIHYQRHESQLSDHRPISGAFVMRVRQLNLHHWQRVQEQVQLNKLHHVQHICRNGMLTTLVNLGLSPQQALHLLQQHDWQLSSIPKPLYL